MSFNCSRQNRWLLANAIGIALCMVLASQFWIEPELADIPGAGVGDASGWIVMAAPIALFFLPANLGWLVRLLLGPRRAGEWISISLALLALTAWIAALLIDNMHHGI